MNTMHEGHEPSGIGTPAARCFAAEKAAIVIAHILADAGARMFPQ